jgi:UDP-N-acetylglucosamine 2-epimerase (non-hydrolysing)
LQELEGVLEYKTLFTGQHTSLVDGPTDYRLEIKTGRSRLDSIVSSIMDSFDFKEEGVEMVLVQGDTTSAYAMAVSAFHHQIPVVHLEAGLRTYDLSQPYPEEANRQMIGRIATIHLCPTDLAKERLLQEKVSGIVEVVGNTVLDNLVGLQTTLEKRVLVTMHRRENHARIREWFKEIERLACQYADYEFVLPQHPNPAVVEHCDVFEKVKVVPPMKYHQLLDYLSSCAYVITDSGGIQEEGSFLRKPCLVCRKETERSEGLNNFSLLCESPEMLFERYTQLQALPLEGPCPYGDGHASAKVAKVLEIYFAKKNKEEKTLINARR